MLEKLIISSALAVNVFVIAASAQSMRFSFGGKQTPAGSSLVSESSVYDKTAGFGFEPESSVICGVKGVAHSCSSEKQFYFSVALPEGNYRATVTLGNPLVSAKTTVKAELRRLMLENVGTAKGKFVSRSFIVNVRTPRISTGGEVRLKDREKTSEWRAWDEKLTLEFNGTHPSVSSIEIEKVDVPTVFLLGDSTVCDQPSEPYASWGQMLTRFFDDRVAVANNAESGESLRSSLNAKRLDKVLSLMKPGDYLLLQYAHNDEKEKGEGVGAFTTFKTDLKHFVEAAKEKGASVILVTPVQRRTFDANGKITNSHGDYPEAVRQAAKEENVPVIDLNTLSKQLYEALGKEGSGVLFKKGDGTHHNNYGAYELAKCIVEGIKANKLGIAKYLAKGLPTFDPGHPDPPAAFAVPASPIATDTKPLGN